MPSLYRIPDTDLFCFTKDKAKYPKIRGLVYVKTATDEIELSNLFSLNAVAVSFGNVNLNLDQLQKYLGGLPSPVGAGMAIVSNFGGITSHVLIGFSKQQQGYKTNKTALLKLAVNLSLNIYSNTGVTVDGSGKLVFARTHSTGNNIFVGKPLSSDIYLELIDEETNGLFTFGIDMNTGSSDIPFGFRYGYPNKKENDYFEADKCDFPLLEEGQTLPLVGYYYPFPESLNLPDEPRLNTVLFNHQKRLKAFQSKFIATNGYDVMLRPGNDAGFKMSYHTLRLIEKDGSWQGDPQADFKEIYFAPRGHFSVLSSSKKKDRATSINLIAGSSGNEYVKLSHGDTIIFSPANPAVLNIPGFGLDKNRDNAIIDLKSSTQTSYFSFSDVRDYCAQPQEAALYKTDNNFREVISGNVNGNYPIPLIPFLNKDHGVITVQTPGNTGTKEYHVEDNFVKHHRTKIVRKTSKNSVRKIGTKDLTTIVAYNGTTPQGFLSDIDGADHTRSIRFSGSAAKPFSIEWPTADLQQSLLQAKTMVLLHPLHYPYLSEKGAIQKAVDIAGWTFEFLREQEKDLKATMIHYREKALFKNIDSLQLQVNFEDLVNEERLRNNLEVYVKELSEYVSGELKNLEGEIDEKKLIFRKLLNDKWQGVVCFRHLISKEAFPPQLRGLFSGIRHENDFFASYLGFDKSKIDLDGAIFNISNPSFFGRINYSDKNLSEFTKDWIKDYKIEKDATAFFVKELLVEFENSCITQFHCEVYFKPGKFFEKLAQTGSSPEDDKIIKIIGTYEKKDGVEAYVFRVHRDPLLKLKFEEGNIIKSIELDTVELNGVDGKNLFLFDGNIEFDFKNPAFRLDGQLLGLFEALYFKNLGLVVGSTPKLEFDFSLFDITANIQLSKLSDGFLKNFPLKLKNFLISWKGQMADQLSLDRLGFIKIGSSNDLFKFALIFELDLGSLGNLVPELGSVKADMIFGWDTDQKFSLGLKLPNVTINKFSFGVQQVIKIEADKVMLGSSKSDPKFYYLSMKKTRIFFLGKNLLESYEDNELFIAVPVDKGKVKWLIRVSKEDAELIKLLAMGYGVKIGGIEASKDFPEAFEKIQSGLPGTPEEIVKLVDNNAGWQFATHLNIEGVADIKIIFSDPALYGLRLNMVDLFEFSILYQRIGNEGVYSIELPPPMGFRQIEMGAASLTFPNLGIDIFTNGSFKIDIGFPRGFDYSRSGALQIIPFIGKGGVYYAMLKNLSYANWPSVPNSSSIYAGVAVKFGLGKEIAVGPLTAGLSLSAYGVLEGAMQLKRDGLKLTLINYRIQGETGIILEIYGSVDFGIVRGGFLVRVGVGTGIIIQKNKAIRLYIKAEVTIKVYVEIRIKVGFVKITISFSFKVHHQVQLNWVLGKDEAEQRLRAIALQHKRQGKDRMLPVRAGQRTKVPVYLVHELTYIFKPGQLPKPQVIFSFAFLSEDNASVSYHQTYRQYARELFNWFEKAFDVWLKDMDGEPASLWTAFFNKIDNSNNSNEPSDIGKQFERLFDGPGILSLFDFELQPLQAQPKDIQLKPIFFTPVPGVKLKDVVNNYEVNFDALIVPESYRTDVLNQHFKDFFNDHKQYNLATAKALRNVPLVPLLLNDYSKSVLKLILHEVKKYLSSLPLELAVTWTQLKSDYILSKIFGEGVSDFESYKTSFVFTSGAIMSRFLRQGLIIPDPADLAKNIPYYQLTGQQHPLSSFYVEDQKSSVDGVEVTDGCIRLKDQAGMEIVLHFDKKELDPAQIMLPEAGMSLELDKPVEEENYRAQLSSELLNGDQPVAERLFYLPLIFNKPDLEVNAVEIKSRVKGGLDDELKKVDPADVDFCTAIEFDVETDKDVNGGDYVLLDHNYEGNLQLLNGILKEDHLKHVQKIHCEFYLEKDNKSTKVNHKSVTLLKTNLSEKSRPVGLRLARNPEDIYYARYEDGNPAADNKDFFKLLRQFTIVNTRGFGILIDSQELPPEGRFKIRLVLSFNYQVLGQFAGKVLKFHNAIRLKKYDAKQTYFIVAGDEKIPHPVLEAHKEKFIITRKITATDVYVNYLYGNIAFDVLPSGTPWPLLNQVKHEKTIPISIENENDGSNTLVYKHTYPIVRYDKENPTISRYSLVQKTDVGALKFWLRDPFGNAYEVPGTHSFRHGYFDPIVPPHEWPGMSLQYSLTADKKLNLQFEFSPAFLLKMSGSSAIVSEESIKATVEKYQEIKEQVEMTDYTMTAVLFQDQNTVQNPSLKPALINMIDGIITMIRKGPAMVTGKISKEVKIAGGFYDTASKQFKPVVLKADTGFVDQFNLQFEGISGDQANKCNISFEKDTIVLALKDDLQETLRKKGENYLNTKKVSYTITYAPNTSVEISYALTANMLKWDKDFSKIGVSLVTTRNKDLVHQAVQANNSLNEIWTATTQVLPAMGKTDLATQFENIFASAKLGVGLDPATDAECFWIINKANLASIKLKDINARDAFYSYKPISTKLYSSAKFRDMDLDEQMHTVNTAVETLLESKYATQLLKYKEEPKLLTDFLEFKKTTAEYFAWEHMLQIVTKQGQPKDPSGALTKEATYYSKESLKNIYGLDTAIQMGVDKGKWTAKSRMYLGGSFIKPDSKQSFNMTYGKLDFQEEGMDGFPILFNYLGNDNSANNIKQFDVDARFFISHIEHNVEKTGSGYDASYWISLILPVVNQFAVAAEKVPVVIRRYPSDTRIIAHSAGYNKTTGDIKEIRLWDYSVRIASQLESQDEYTMVVFRNRSGELKTMGRSGGLNYEAICEAAYLWKLKQKEMLEFSPASFELLKEFRRWCQLIHNSVRLDSGRRGDDRFTIKMKVEKDLNQFVKNLELNCAEHDAFEVRYFGKTSTGKQDVVFKLQRGKYVPSTPVQVIPDGYLTITLKNLDLLQVESAEAAMQVKRNTNFALPSGYAINESFVYETALQLFGQPLFPEKHAELAAPLQLPLAQIPTAIRDKVLKPLAKQLKNAAQDTDPRKIELEIRYEKREGLESAVHLNLPLKYLQTDNINDIVDGISKLDVFNGMDLNTGSKIKTRLQLFSSSKNMSERKLLFVKGIDFII